MGSYSSYREASEEYKKKKQDHTFLGEKEISHKKKKKKKKNKRANHKHEYVSAIYNMSYKRVDGKVEKHQTCGAHCKICGRVQDMYFLWFNTDDKLEKFKKENPNYIELVLPEDWDYFKDKYLPV